jgi:hypothetical protein
LGMARGHDSAFSRIAASRVNVPFPGGNPETVLNSTTAPAVILGLGLLSGACAAEEQASAPFFGREEGTTTLRVTNHVTGPESLEGVLVDVDGEPLALGTVPPAGGAPAVLGSLRLAPGPHTLAVRARARAPGAEVVVVGAQQPFLVERRAAGITIDVWSRAPGTMAAEPLAVSLAIVGGRTTPEIGAPPPDDKDERCAALQPIPRALCRAAIDLDQAARRNDVAAVHCVRDKLTEMRRLALVGDATREESVALAEVEVGKLARLVDHCGGEAMAAPLPDGLTVIRPGTR